MSRKDRMTRGGLISQDDDEWGPVLDLLGLGRWHAAGDYEGHMYKLTVRAPVREGEVVDALRCGHASVSVQAPTDRIAAAVLVVRMQWHDRWCRL